MEFGARHCHICWPYLGHSPSWLLELSARESFLRTTSLGCLPAPIQCRARWGRLSTALVQHPPTALVAPWMRFSSALSAPSLASAAGPGELIPARSFIGLCLSSSVSPSFIGLGVPIGSPPVTAATAAYHHPLGSTPHESPMPMTPSLSLRVGRLVYYVYQLTSP